MWDISEVELHETVVIASVQWAYVQVNNFWRKLPQNVPGASRAQTIDDRRPTRVGSATNGGIYSESYAAAAAATADCANT